MEFAFGNLLEVGPAGGMGKSPQLGHVLVCSMCGMPVRGFTVRLHDGDVIGYQGGTHIQYALSNQQTHMLMYSSLAFSLN